MRTSSMIEECVIKMLAVGGGNRAQSVLVSRRNVFDTHSKDTAFVCSWHERDDGAVEIVRICSSSGSGSSAKSILRKRKACK